MTTEGLLERDGRRTWYRLTGERTSFPPLLMLHGGPGACTADDQLAVNVVARDRLVVEYDQLDTGRSSRVGDPSVWTVEAHLDELDFVRRSLGLDDIHLGGQSWGGMLALAHVVGGARGVRSLTMSGSPVAVPRWLDTASRFRAGLPPSTQRALDRCERTLLAAPPPSTEPGPGPSSAALRRRAAVMAGLVPLLTSAPVQRLAQLGSRLPALRRAVYPVVSLPFITRHVFRRARFPMGMLVGMAGMNAGVYETMWGPSEFTATGPLRDFDLTDRLHEVGVPLLVTSGAHELASPDQMRDLVDAVAGAQWELFEDCGHASAYEEPERHARVVREFLLANDRTAVH